MQRFGGKFINGLQSLGFLHGFRRFPLHSSSNSLQINLVSSPGLSHFQAFSTSSKLSYQNLKLIEVNTSLDANSVVCFFKDYGFNETQIQKIVSLNPALLCSKVDKTLKPKFDFFKDEGFSKDDVIRIISANPYFITMSLDSTIAPAIRILREVLICNSHVIFVLVRLRLWRLGGGCIVHHLLPNVDLLSSYGISIEVIRKHLLMRPLVFCRKPENFRDIVTKVDKRLGISRGSPSFMYVIQLACSYSEENIESKFQMFKSFGWTQSDVERLLMRNAFCFTLSNENIKKKLGFLMNELRLEPAFLANKCCMFTLSLEKRLVPRHHVFQILKEKRLLKKSPSFYSIVCMAESRFFLKMYVLPFKEVHQVYAKHIGCTVESLTQERADDLE